MSHKVPRDIERFLKRYGGTNPYRQPKWRLSVGSEVLVKEAGVYRDWAEGLSTAEKGGLVFSPSQEVPGLNFQHANNKPLRVVTEMREVQKYPQCVGAGWILERWFPASAYGSREDWHSYKASDGVTPMLGPYPEQGDYEMQFGPWVKIPSIEVLERLIGGYARQMAERTGTPEARAQQYLLRYLYEQEQAEIKRKEEYEAMMRDELTPMHSGSLAASRWRQELAERTGNRNEHIGIL